MILYTTMCCSTQVIESPIITLPDPIFCWNHKSSLAHEEFVGNAMIKELVTVCCVKQCPAVCSSVSVGAIKSVTKSTVLM